MCPKQKNTKTEHQRKSAKVERLLSGGTRQPFSKDPGIPNLCRYKAQLRAQVEGHQQRLQQQKDQQKEKRNKAQQKQRAGQEQPSCADLSELRTRADERGRAFAEKDTAGEAEDIFIREMAGKHSKAISSNRKAFYQELRKVVASSDILLEVLDARDPLGSRSPQLEHYVNSLNRNKRIVLVLNKIDLVPREVVREWIAFLSTDYPTVAFKCVTSQARGAPAALAPEASTAPALANITHAECLGSDTLLHLLKSYARSHNIMTHITVGVVGFPNVGKSSLINSLKRTKAVTVSSVPGTTTHMQSVHLDQKVALLDCPGVIFSSGSSESDVLRNCLRIEKVEDPVAPVGILVQRVPATQLCQLYDIPEFGSSPDEFLSHIARKLGKLKKGGLPDLNAAARLVLHDWNEGKIPFFTPPPPSVGAKPPEELFTNGTATIVSEFAPEFDLNAVQGELVARLPEAAVMGPMVALPSAGLAGCAAASASREGGGALELDGEVTPAESARRSAAPKLSAEELIPEAEDGDDDDDDDHASNSSDASAAGKSARRRDSDVGSDNGWVADDPFGHGSDAAADDDAQQEAGGVDEKTRTGPGKRRKDPAMPDLKPAVATVTPVHQPPPTAAVVSPSNRPADNPFSALAEPDSDEANVSPSRHAPAATPQPPAPAATPPPAVREPAPMSGRGRAGRKAKDKKRMPMPGAAPAAASSAADSLASNRADDVLRVRRSATRKTGGLVPANDVLNPRAGVPRKKDLKKLKKQQKRALREVGIE